MPGLEVQWHVTVFALELHVLDGYDGIAVVAGAVTA
jgi:hypothetical protein